MIHVSPRPARCRAKRDRTLPHRSSRRTAPCPAGPLTPIRRRAWGEQRGTCIARVAHATVHAAEPGHGSSRCVDDAPDALDALAHCELRRSATQPFQPSLTTIAGGGRRLQRGADDTSSTMPAIVRQVVAIDACHDRIGSGRVTASSLRGCRWRRDRTSSQGGDTAHDALREFYRSGGVGG